ncbi:MAG: fatty acid cis/trans isomerase [Arcobacteraceae bacterium]
MRIYLFLLPILLLYFQACSVKPLDIVEFERVNKEISYTKEVKPILDNRCVSCHSCYNSSCQLKLSSYEGLERGGSKVGVYENRLRAIAYKTNDYKKEFANRVLKYTNNKIDDINYIKKAYIPSEIREKYNSIKEVEESFKSLSIADSVAVVKSLSDDNSNLAYIKIEMNNGENLVYTLVVNKWLENVAFLFDEHKRRDTSKDDIDFIRGFIGSYPNAFVVVKQDDLPEFFELFKNYNETKDEKKRFLKFVINRANPKFWEIFDWFDAEFKKQNPLEYGLFDINRYFPEAINEEDIIKK